MTMQLFGNLGAIVALVVFAGHLVLYGMFSPWWRSPTGRAMVALVAVIAATMALTVGTISFGVQWPARLFLRGMIFWSIALAGGWLLVSHARQKLAAWRTANDAEESEESDEARI